MIGALTLYRMKGSLSAGEYPLFYSGQNLSTYEVANFPRVKYRDGMQVEATVPYASGMRDANVAMLDGRYYWVTAFRQKTAEQDQYILTLDYMGPTTEFREGETVRGNWHKLPFNYCPYLKQEISNSIKLIQNSYRPTDLEIGRVRRQSSTGFDAVGYWVQVTGYNVDSNNRRTSLKSCGFVIGVNTSTAYPIAQEIQTEIVLAETTIGKFPTFEQLISNITAYTGLQADQIIDVSISARCPFRFRKVYYSDSGIEAYRVVIQRANGYDWLATESEVQGYYYFELLGALFQATWRHDNVQTVTVPTSSAFLRQCGSVVIRDWNENTLMEIPIDSSSMDIEFRTHSDINGVYTIVSHRDQQISIPEGKLPYVENAYESYKAYQLNGDREAMHNAIQEAKFSRETSDMVGMLNSTISGISTGVMADAVRGNMAGMVTGAATGLIGAGVSLWESGRAKELTELQAQNALELSKKRGMNQPQTSYNSAYGMLYCTLNKLNSLRVCTILPDNITASYYNDWSDVFGYPVEGVIDAEIETGFYQGKLIDRYGGMYSDRTNETFMRGFKFVDP